MSRWSSTGPQEAVLKFLEKHPEFELVGVVGPQGGSLMDQCWKKANLGNGMPEWLGNGCTGLCSAWRSASSPALCMVLPSAHWDNVDSSASPLQDRTRELLYTHHSMGYLKRRH